MRWARWSALAIPLVTGCGVDAGIVELNWEFLDATADRGIGNTCDLRAEDGSAYALRVELLVSENGCEGDECEVARERFACERTRGSALDVPASDEPYLMQVFVVAEHGNDETVLGSQCAAVPGPRTRTVHAGQITDLAVYELIIHAIDGDQALDLEGCAADA